MGYVERILQPGESILHAARLHWFIYLKGLALLLLALVCIMFALAVGSATSRALRSRCGSARAFSGCSGLSRRPRR